MNEGEQNAVKSKRKYLKIGVIAIGAAVFLLMIFFGLSKYGEWSLERNIKKIIENENRPYLEDTYGGKTPKETLELFIAAVEKEDFDLASKYFILSKQGEWRSALLEANRNEKLHALMQEIKEANNSLDKESPIWEKQDSYVYITKNSVAFEFIKYPRDIWKIKEI